MALEHRLSTLHQSLSRLVSALDDLEWAVVQAQPESEPGHALVDRYDAATTDVSSLARDALAAALDAREASGVRNLARARDALATCHERSIQIDGRFHGDLVSFESIDALDSLARERREAWATWVRGVKDALSGCRGPIQDVAEALCQCWLDLTEQALARLPLAQAISTGPNIVLAGRSADVTADDRPVRDGSSGD